MKFTELLAEYQVPEWKSQYVDYKWGKKLLKKIPDDLKDRLKRHTTFNGEIDAPTEPQNIAARQQAVHVDQVAGDAGISPRTIDPSAGAPVASPNAGITPGALLGEPSETAPINSGSETENYGATGSREGSAEGDDDKAHDQSGTRPGSQDLGTSYMSRERLSRGQSGHPTPILLSKISTSGGDSVKLPPAAMEGGRTPEMAPHRGTITRNKSSSGRADSVKAKFHIGTPKITPEVNTNYAIMDKSFSLIPPDGSEKDFIAWLDSQLDKVNEFYDQKMNETHERYRILVGQLVRLQRQKLHLRQRPNKPAREGLSVVERQIELPSLPSFGWLKKDDRDDCELQPENSCADSQNALRGQNPHFHDATTDHEGISYASARRQLKTAMQEYYRSIELLRSYCTLNRTAFRKILKKYDKVSGRHMSPYYMDLVDHTDFCNVDNSRLDIVASKVEDLYTNNFERGNRKHAISKLRSTGVNKTYYFATFRGGIFFGLAIPFFIEGLYKGCLNLVEHKSPDTAYLLQIWAGFFLILLFLLFFPLCCLVWNKYKINYTFIFEFAQDHLDYRQFFEMPAFYFFFMSIFSWLTFYSYWESSFRAVYYPCIFLVFAVVTFFMPINIFYWSARQWLIRALSRILLSGLYPVEFRDFFIGDIICSMTYSMSNVALFFCLYSHEWSEGFHGVYNPSHCGSSHNRLVGFFNAVPGIFRWLQCLRRFADTGDAFPHLANMTKYSLTIMYYVAQSVWRIDTTNGNRAFFIFFATVNSTYCYIWDIMMDWSLLEFGSKNFLLRNQLTYKVKWPYYTAMVIDFVLRFNWIWYAIFEQQIQQKQLLSFFVALSEIFRRLMWMLIRMENEHVSNVKRFRASRDVPLPYHIHVCSEPGETDETAVEDGGSHEEDEEEEARDRMGSSTGVEWARDSPGMMHDSPRKPSRANDSPLRKRNSHVEEGNTPASLKSTATPVMEAISNMVQKAHTADFQRRKQPRDDQGKDSDGEDDDDDEDDDE